MWKERKRERERVSNHVEGKPYGFNTYFLGDLCLETQPHRFFWWAYRTSWRVTGSYRIWGLMSSEHSLPSLMRHGSTFSFFSFHCHLSVRPLPIQNQQCRGTCLNRSSRGEGARCWTLHPQHLRDRPARCGPLKDEKRRFFGNICQTRSMKNRFS